jgi:hypothetical protein
VKEDECLRERMDIQVSKHNKEPNFNNILTPTGACVACVQVPNVLVSLDVNGPLVRVVTPSTTTA